ncbi:MAG: phosphomethylpyrimidine synthase ThiC [candidate division Zixibacteria bacterium]|nr:phosphomethylpyrimidine synthase ThiC [candidate division Zixibacteria bacterium]
MTQLKAAVDGRVTTEMKRAAAAENVPAETVRAGIAEGVTVLPFNEKLDERVRAVAVGKGLRTKVNANIGSSRDHADVRLELCKARVAEEAGADALMDLSTGGDLHAIRRAILRETSLPVGTVPVYEVAARAEDEGREFEDASVDEMFDVVEEHARDGVSFMTLHAGVTRYAVERLKSQGRELDIVSRGGALMAGWMARREAENPFYEFFDRLVELALEYDFTFSLGDGLRPGCLADANDRAQITELLALAELAKRARERGAQVMLEGPGHVPLNAVAEHVRLQKAVGGGAPFYTLGPLVTDVAPGYDHITAAIGGAVAAAAGVDFLCYVTPAEHLSLPGPEDVRLGVIASRIAAHAGDVAKGVVGAADWDLEMSRARRSLDWKRQAELAVDPAEAARRRSENAPKVEAETCTMCSNMCAIKLSEKALAE